MVRQRDRRRGVECGQVWYPHIAATDGMEEHPRDATSISTSSKSFAPSYTSGYPSVGRDGTNSR